MLGYFQVPRNVIQYYVYVYTFFIYISIKGYYNASFARDLG